MLGTVLSTFLVVCLSVLCIYADVSVHTCGCVRRLEVNLGYFPLLLSILFFKAWSLIEPGVAAHTHKLLGSICLLPGANGRHPASQSYENICGAAWHMTGKNDECCKVFSLSLTSWSQVAYNIAVSLCFRLLTYSHAFLDSSCFSFVDSLGFTPYL